MKNTLQKPSFGEVVVTATINLDDVGLSFNARRVGPKSFADLRNGNYGPGFRMPTISELIPLVYASLENRKYKTMKSVIKTLRKNSLIGNTGIRYIPDGMFIQDKPKLENGRISMNQKSLEKRLGSHEEKGIIFSDDRTIRFVPYGFKVREQTAFELSRNPGVIALTGSEENAEKLAKSSEYYRLKPWFYALSNINSQEIRVAGLHSGYFNGRLFVLADVSEDYDDRFSFGVSENTEGLAKNK